MKHIYTITLLIFSIVGFAQENNQFVENFTKFAKITDGKFGELQEGNATIIFNYGQNNNIKIYFAGGSTEVYSRVSDVTKDTTKTGEKFQYSKMLDEKGEEIYFVKYDDGEVRIMYLNSFSTTKGYGIALLP